MSSEAVDSTLTEEPWVKFRVTLSSPFKRHRLATLNLLHDDASKSCNILHGDKKNIELCLSIEAIDTTHNNFREKQNLLIQLSQIVASNQTSESFRRIGMLFILGCLYVNFTPLWKPIQQMLISCIHSDSKQLSLKEIVTQKLQDVFTLLNGDDRSDFHEQQILLKEVVEDTKLHETKRERPDHVTYVVNLLGVMESTSEFFEPISRTFVPLFLDLSAEVLNLERLNTEFEESLDHEDEQSEDVDEDTGQEIELKDAEDSVDQSTSIERITIDEQDKWRLILSFLKLMSKFKNPKAAVRCQELEALYHEFLISSRTSISEYAFQCLCVINSKQLNPYKEKMLTFFKEQGFKFALSDFTISSANEDDRVLKDKDREVVMPILLKVLVGRMKTRTTSKKLKSASQHKRALIMRYVAGCSDHEVNYFLRLNFSFIEPFLCMDYQDLMHKKLSWNGITTHKMEGSLKTLISMMTSLGNLVSDSTLQQFLKILLVISCYTRTEEGEEVTKRVKSLRSHCIKNLIVFFSDFDEYPFKEEEIQAIYLFLVNPSMKSFSSDNMGNVSQILLLFKTWSENSRFFPLINFSMNSVQQPLPMIVKVLESGKAVKAVETVVLSIIHNLLTLQDISSYRSEAMETDSLPKSIELTGCISFDGKVILKPFLSMIIAFYANRLKLMSRKSRGTRQLQSRDLKVLQSLSEIVEDSKDCLCLAQLLIEVFSRHYISDHESTQEYSETIFKLVSQSGSQATKLIGSIAPLFLTVKESSVRIDLSKTVETMVKHGVLRQESQSHQQQEERKKSANEGTTTEDSKKEDPVQENEKLENVVLMLSESVRLLHECSHRRIDEPDFDSRFQGFDKITQAVKCVSQELERQEIEEAKLKLPSKEKTKSQEKPTKEQEEDKSSRKEGAVKESESASSESRIQDLLKMTLDLLKITAYSCCFFLTQSSLDQSLKTCSCTLLETMAKEFGRCNKKKFFSELCITIVLYRGIRSGFTDSNEKTRFEFIGVLRSLIANARDKHPHLMQMSRLMHRDIEVDFWQNVKHLQYHRRAKAFSRLAEKPKLLQKLSQEVLWNYILPLTEKVLLQEEPRAPEHLLNASIELIGSVSRLLDYRLYEQLLRKYLTIMSKGDSYLSPTLVRTISKILSNFNYDLSNASEDVLLSLRHESPLTASSHHEKMNQREDEKEGTDVVDKTGHETPDKNDGEDALNINEGEDVLMQSQEDEEATSTLQEEQSSRAEITNDMLSRDEEEESDQTETDISSGNMRKLSQKEATLVLSSIIKGLLPQLNKAVFEVSYSDYDSKSKKIKDYDERDEVQRIPIAIAVVKLLVIIPSRFKILEANLTGILLRLCHFLKSRTDSIREVARKSLKIIVSDIGASFLPDVLKELKNSLTRGLQRHILSFTVHYLLINMKDVIVTGSLDDMFPLLLDIVFDDLFGKNAEEKEVEAIKSKAKEIKKNKGYEILHTMSSIAGETSIVPLFARFKTQLSLCRSFKDVKKVTKSLDVLVLGLSVNESLSMKTLCTLIYGISREQIEELKRGKGVEDGFEIKKRSHLRLRPESCLLIQDPLKTRKKPSKVSSVNHMFVLTEKSLVLLHQLLKNRRLKNSDREHLSLLDPLIVILVESLSSKHVKLVCAAMRCILNICVEFPGLPSLKANCNVIKNHLFMILAENSKYGGNDAEHRIMIELSFKLISLMIGSISRVTVTNDQIVVLLTHIDEDITLGGTKPTSFILLNALLERNILNKEVHNIMRAVFKLTIQSENETVRDRCVKACSLYLKQYEKSGKAVVNHLLFFVRHLEYETEPGRMSAIRVILSAIKTFDGSLLETNFNLLLIPLGCRLINEDSFLCKESIYQALKHLILSVNQEKRDKMFQQLILPWFEDQDFKKNILAIHVMSIMIEGETDFLEKRGLNILPLLLKNLRDSAEQEAIQEEKDRLYFQQLTLLRQLLMTDEVLVIRRNNKEPAPQELLEKKDPTRVKKTKSNAAVSPLDILRQEVDQTWNVLQDFYLMYPHSWVRLITAQIFGHLFSLYDPQDLATGVSLSEVRAAASSSLGDEYLIRETRGETKFLLTLTKKFVSLFRGISDLQDPLAEQLVQNLGFVAKLVIFRDRLRREQNTQEKLSNNDCNKDRQETKKVKIERVPREEENDFEEEKVENETEEPFSLKQFVYEIMRAIKLELSLSRSSICIRSHIFKLIAILVVELEKHELVSVLDQLLNPLVREVTDPRNALKTTTASTIQTPDPNNKSSNSFEGNEGRENLLLLSQQVLDIIKPLVGDEVFKHSYTQTQLDIKKRRLQRKQEKAIDAVTNPEREYLRKIKEHERKRQGVKRKKLHELLLGQKIKRTKTIHRRHEERMRH